MNSLGLSIPAHKAVKDIHLNTYYFRENILYGLLHMEFPCHLFGLIFWPRDKHIQYAEELQSKIFILLKDAMHIIRGTLRLTSSCR